ncbi:lactate racemase domain-containing protein [Chloroflexota bacterium]
MPVLKLPQLAWYGIKELELPLADSWQIETCHMAGYNRPTLTSDQIKAAVTQNLIGTPPIRELAKGKKEVVIIFDDMTRATRVADIVPFVLDELAEADIPDDRIRFIAALGCHRDMNRLDFVKKLGKETLARFPVYNHNPFANCTYAGATTTYGTKVYVNEEVMKCDLRIAISSVVPHPRTGFSGGGKIILPGVSSFETAKHTHQMFYQTAREQGASVMGMGIFDTNPGRGQIEEAAMLIGLDVLINCLLNMWGETVAIFAGALKPTYVAAVQEAKTHYLTPKAGDKDIVIANTFAKANEAWIGLPITYQALKPEGGDAVLIGNTPEGQVLHYLLGPFGNTIRGPLWREREIPRQVKHLIVYTEYPDLASQGWFGNPDKTCFLHKWDDVLRALQESYGKDAKVVVYPNADIQYCQ